MIELASSLITLALSLVQFVINSIFSLVRMIQALFQFVSYSTVAIAYVPIELFAFVSIGISVLVLMFIIGR